MGSSKTKAGANKLAQNALSLLAPALKALALVDIYDVFRLATAAEGNHSGCLAVWINLHHLLVPAAGWAG